ncbi:MAG: hypothetical protein GVY25_03230 [Bacteroidetes bacterium]|jgi:hypothetical protein|nr:hypothetical protein [Bacteroidota bacterium]
MRSYQKAIRIVGGTLVVYALLVASHLGEFWPFSIYPMFSQAGNPWTRAIVRQVPQEGEAVDWRTIRLESLPGEAFGMVENGINQNDVANYLSKTDVWTTQRLRGFRSMFDSNHEFGPPLRVYRVRGTLRSDSVDIDAMPVMQITADTTFFHPNVAVQLDSSSDPASYASR